MNPALILKAKCGEEAAQHVANAIGSDQPLAKAAASLAAECLRLTTAPFSWQLSHELIQDLGVYSLRKRLLCECSGALMLAADAARRLAVHGTSGAPSEVTAARLEELGLAIRRSLQGMDTCEEVIRERIAEPRLAELSLEQRKTELHIDPTAQSNRLAQLAKEVEQAETALANQRGSAALMEERHRDAKTEERILETRCQQLEENLVRVQGEMRKLDSKAKDLEQQRDGNEQNLASASSRLVTVQRELEAMRNDPRDVIRDAVCRAIQQLPNDALDTAVEGIRVK